MLNEKNIIALNDAELAMVDGGKMGKGVIATVLTAAGVAIATIGAVSGIAIDRAIRNKKEKENEDKEKETKDKVKRCHEFNTATPRYKKGDHAFGGIVEDVVREDQNGLAAFMDPNYNA